MHKSGELLHAVVPVAAAASDTVFVTADEPVAVAAAVDDAPSIVEVALCTCVVLCCPPLLPPPCCHPCGEACANLLIDRSVTTELNIDGMIILTERRRKPEVES